MNRLRSFSRDYLLPLIIGAALLWVATTSAHDYTAGKIFIAHPWARPTAPGMPMGAAYFTLENRGDTDDFLVAASTPVAERVEFHETTMTEGMARMRPLAGIALPAGKTVRVEPGGVHAMLIELKQALVAGSEVPLVLEFRHAGRIEVALRIEQRDLVSAIDTGPPRSGRPIQ